MPNYSIPIILGTTRNDTESQKVAKYLHEQLSKKRGLNVPYLDLGQTDFPLLDDRVTPNHTITPTLAKWTQIVSNANGLIVVVPEYKSGYIGALKNFLDYLPAGVFRYKPVGICTVSAGVNSGTSCSIQLKQIIIGMAGLVIPDKLQIEMVEAAFDKVGDLKSEQSRKIAEKFISELLNYSISLEKIQIGY